MFKYTPTLKVMSYLCLCCHTIGATELLEGGGYRYINIFTQRLLVKYIFVYKVKSIEQVKWFTIVLCILMEILKNWAYYRNM